jgi:LEA14-like dessication related protein
MRSFAFLFSVLALLFCAGCVTEPAVKLYGARISHVTPQGVGLTMTMKVMNDNSFDIMLRGVRANATIAQRFQIPTVQAAPQQWLPAGRATLVQVPVVIPWAMVTPLIQTTVTTPSIRYRMVGFADVTATRALEIDFDDYKFDQQGAFSRAELVLAAGRGFLGERPVVPAEGERFLALAPPAPPEIVLFGAAVTP